MQNNLSLKPFLNTVVKDPLLHSRWLNTFSFLEYIGFRKIVKSQEATAMTSITLAHAVEEGRHALLLKKLALRVATTVGSKAVDDYSPQSLICGEEAEGYFQTLDHECENSLPSSLTTENRSRLTYLYVTWLVEKRALEVYGQYHEALIENGRSPTLQGLLAEEKGHLGHVETELQKHDPDFASRSEQLIALETRLYLRFVEVVSREISRDVEAPSLSARSHEAHV